MTTPTEARAPRTNAAWTTAAAMALSAIAGLAHAQDATNEGKAPATIEQDPAAEAPEPLEGPKPFKLLPDPWAGSIDAGVVGSSGNTDNLSVRVNAAAERIIEDVEETRLFATFFYQQDDGEDTENRFETGIRHDWLLPDSKWRYFARAGYEYDEFQNWDHRIVAGGGLGYEFINNDTTTLVGRAGLQAAWELGGDGGDRFTPEGILGIDFEHQLTERQKIFFTGDYLPALDDFFRYRAVAKAGWEIMLDPEANLYLRAGIEDRYDSSPGADTKRNDLDYFITVGTTF